jgi:DNA-binding transcriptional ArsR family regulator
MLNISCTRFAPSCIVHAVPRRQRHLTAVFAALGDPIRFGILARLTGRGESTVTALAKPFRISLPAISRHLRILERARLIERRRKGRVHFIRARAAGLKQAQSWITRCAAAWDFQFDALDELLHTEKRKETKK